MVNKTVFICEDDKANVEVMSLLLQELSAQVYLPKEYDSIIVQVTKENPACIIMDLSIGQISGITLIKELRSHKTTAHIPIILFSASADLELEAQKMSINAILKKPFEINDFKRVVSQYLAFT